MAELTKEQMIMFIDMYADPHARPYAIQMIKPYINEYKDQVVKMLIEALEGGLEGATNEVFAEIANQFGAWMYSNKDQIAQNPQPVLQERAKEILMKGAKGAALGIFQSLVGGTNKK